MNKKTPVLLFAAITSLFTGACGDTTSGIGELGRVQYMISTHYVVPEDYVEAVKWYRKAAEQGDADAQSNLGYMYYKGQGVPQDYAEAVKWIRKAAEQGHADAQVGLGWMYFEGRGVPKNYVAAYGWFSVAAASGNGSAVRGCEMAKGRLTPSQVEKGEAMVREISERIEKRKAAKAE